MTSIRASKFKKVVDDRNLHWSLQDEILYDLCRKYPTHGKIDKVCAKMSIIGRTYATGIERQIASDGTAASSLTKLTSAMHKRCKQVDDIISTVRDLGSDLSQEALAVIVVEHKRFIDLLRKEPGTAKTPRSFVSKYLHFHSPIVPLFDGKAQKGIQRVWPWGQHRKGFIELPSPPKVDQEYRDYCLQFWSFFSRLREMGIQASVKEADYFLMSEGEDA